MANVTFNGVDLSGTNYGLSVLSLDRSVPGVDVISVAVPGREYDDTWASRPTALDFMLTGSVTDPSSTHVRSSSLLTKVANIAAACDAQLGWKNLAISGVTGKHLICMGNGVVAKEDYPVFRKPSIPVELHFRRRPYWYADAPTTGTLVATLNNPGSVVAYPVWTFTVGGGGEANGFTLTVGTQVFQYNAATAANDVVVVNSNPGVLSVTLNGRAVAPNAVFAFTAYPSLAPGVNATTKTGNVTVTYSFEARYLFGA